MDREIIFRGKGTANDEWVYGYYAGEVCVAPFSPTIKQDNIIQFGSNLWFEVIPETVGQYTGLTDKNGVKIFEGDIVKYSKSVHEVVFCDFAGNAFFGISFPERGEIWAFSPSVSAERMTIIGNIYDNPELLGEESAP